MFPAGTITLQAAWISICEIGLRMRGRVLDLRNASAAADTGRTSYRLLQEQLDDAIDDWAETISNVDVPSLEAFARGQVKDDTLDLQAEYLAMRNAGIALRLKIYDDMPKDPVTGALLLYESNLAGDLIELMFTTAQTAGFRTQADLFIATVKPTP